MIRTLHSAIFLQLPACFVHILCLSLSFAVKRIIFMLRPPTSQCVFFSYRALLQYIIVELLHTAVVYYCKCSATTYSSSILLQVCYCYFIFHIPFFPGLSRPRKKNTLLVALSGADLPSSSPSLTQPARSHVLSFSLRLSSLSQLPRTCARWHSIPLSAQKKNVYLAAFRASLQENTENSR